MWWKLLKKSFRDKLLYHTSVLPPLAGEVNTILLIRFSALGDVLHTTPVITALKTSWPHSRISYLTDIRFREILETNPELRDVFTINRDQLKRSSFTAVLELVRLVRTLRNQHFDLIIDLHGFNETGLLAVLSGSTYRLGKIERISRYCYNLHAHENTRAGRHPLDHYRQLLAPLNIVVENTELKLYLDQDDRRFAEKYFEVHNLNSGTPIIAINPGGSRRKKRWAPSKWAKLGDILYWEYGINILLIAGPRERNLALEIQNEMNHREQTFILQTSIRKCAAALEKTMLLISSDSGPLHMAVAVGIPTVALVVDKNRGNFRSLSAPQKIISRIRMDELEVADVVDEMREFFELWINQSSSFSTRTEKNKEY